MKDSKFYPAPRNPWNGGVMSGGGLPEEGRGHFPAWSTSGTPPPISHHPLPQHNSVPRMMPGFFGTRTPSMAHLGGWVRGMKPPDSGVFLVSPADTGGQAEGIDLSRAGGAVSNGSQLNGQAKEAVSVIAANPLRQEKMDSDHSDDDEDCMVIEEGEEAPPEVQAAPLALRSSPPSVPAHPPVLQIPSVQSHPGLPAMLNIPSVPPHRTPPGRSPPRQLQPSHFRLDAPSIAVEAPTLHQAPEEATVPRGEPAAVCPASSRTPPIHEGVPTPFRALPAASTPPSLPIPTPPAASLPPIPLPASAPSVSIQAAAAPAPRSISPPVSTASTPQEAVVPVPKIKQLPPPLEAKVQDAPVTPSPPGIPSVPDPSGTKEAATPASPVAAAGPRSSSPGVPSSVSKDLSPAAGASSSAALPTCSSTPVAPKKAPPTPSTPVDHVESLLEDMFQQDGTPIPHPVIVPNSNRTPALTDDKVVAILEESESADKDVKPKTPTPAKNNTFMQVESELEKMFAGIVEEEPDIKPDVEQLDIKKPIKRKKSTKPRRRRSVSEKKKKLSEKEKKKGRKIKIVKDGSNDSSVLSATRSRGPFVRLVGGREAPASVVVVNYAGRDEDDGERVCEKVKRKIPRIVEGRLRGPGLYGSTLSSKYNSNSADMTWVCIFCKKRSNCEGGLGGEPAGDLFGPYMVTVQGENLNEVPLDSEVSAEQRRRGAGKQQSLRAARAAHTFAQHQAKKGNKQAAVVEEEGSREVWLHEQCAVWAPGVIMVGPHLIGLDDAVSSALITKCSKCGVTGATVSCLNHGCNETVHYGCAVEAGWNLDTDTFQSHCPAHFKAKIVTLEMLKSMA